MAMQKIYLVLLCLLILALTLSSCGVPQEEYDALRAELVSAQSEIENLQGELASSQSEIENLQGELTSSQSEIENLQDELTTQSATLAQVQSSNTALREQIFQLENELDVILDTTVTQYYQFTYRWGDYYWTLPIPLRTYFYYKEKPRPISFLGYSSMVTDPYDDSLIDGMVRNLGEAAVTKNLSMLEKTNFVVAFIQSLPYTEDVVTTPYDEYPRYPAETLFDRGGDCEDTSILAATLLTAMGYNVVLLVFEEEQHMAIGVDIPNANALGYYWEYQGEKYFYLETTGEGWQIGDCPSEYRKALAHMYSVGR